MEQFKLNELFITQHGQTSRLRFTSAQLVIVTELGSKLWFIDVSGIAQKDILLAFSTSSNIQVDLQAVTTGGRRYRGIGYLHPNVQHQAAAIRGDGELERTTD